MRHFDANWECQRSSTSARNATPCMIGGTPVPWSFANGQRAAAQFGPDLWPDGLDANRVTLGTFLEFAFEQGVCSRRLTLDELFPVDVDRTLKI